MLCIARKSAEDTASIKEEDEEASLACWPRMGGGGGGAGAWTEAEAETATKEREQ